MAEIQPIVCTEDELVAARIARNDFIFLGRKQRILIDGNVTEWAAISVTEINATIAGMQRYQDSVSVDVVTAFSISASKGF